LAVFFSRFICLDILRQTNDPFAPRIVRILMCSAVIVFMSIITSVVIHSLYIQCWLTALIANYVMVTTFLKS